MKASIKTVNLLKGYTRNTKVAQRNMNLSGVRIDIILLGVMINTILLRVRKNIKEESLIFQLHGGFTKDFTSEIIIADRKGQIMFDLKP